MAEKLKIHGIISGGPVIDWWTGEEITTFYTQKLVDFLDSHTGDTIEIDLSTDGGDIEAAYEMYDRLVNSGKTINVTAYKAHSAGTVFLTIGAVKGQTEVSENIGAVVHLPWAGFFYEGDYRGLELLADDFRKAADKLFNFYVEKLQLDESKKDELRALYDAGTELNADQLIHFGFASKKIQAAESEPAKKASIVPFAYTPALVAKFKNEKNNEEMSFLKDLKKEIADLKAMLSPKKKAANVTSEDGTVMYFEGDTIEVGTAVFSDEAMTAPLADGSYTADGNVYTVSSGVVTEITETESTEGVEALAQEVAALKASVTEMQRQHKADIDAKDAIISALKEVVPGDKGGVSSHEGKQTKRKSNLLNGLDA